MSVTTPCVSCPFRVERHAKDIPNFKLALAEALISSTTGELNAPVFACHLSRVGREIVCRGWLVRHGWDSIAVRLMLARGSLRPEDLEVGADWPELHADYDEVLVKLRRDCAVEEDPIVEGMK